MEKWNTGTILHYLAGAEPLAAKCLKKTENVTHPMEKWDPTKGEVYDPP